LKPRDRNKGGGVWGLQKDRTATTAGGTGNRIKSLIIEARKELRQIKTKKCGKESAKIQRRELWRLDYQRRLQLERRRDEKKGKEIAVQKWASKTWMRFTSPKYQQWDKELTKGEGWAWKVRRL